MRKPPKLLLLFGSAAIIGVIIAGLICTLVESNSVSHSAMNKSNLSFGGKSKIYFLKTHKTASSTLENIMMRLAWKYNRTIARPTGTGYINFSLYYPLRRKMIRNIPTKPEDLTPAILTQHSRYSSDIKALYPPKTSYKFSILRGMEFYF